MPHKVPKHRYLVALGSNQRHPRFGSPAAVINAAIRAVTKCGLKPLRISRLMQTAPVGPSMRQYVNAAITIEARMEPRACLSMLQSIEKRFGRRDRGQRWRARVLDLDVILWSGGMWCDEQLTIPHPLFRERRFVLRPAVQVAPHWRDPITGFRLNHLRSRLDRKRPCA